MGKKKKKKETKQRGVLSGHKKVGKTFVPPMRQLGDFQFVNWQSRIVPELVWMAELINRFDLIRAAELALGLARSAKQVLASQHGVWFGAASAYCRLTTAMTYVMLGRLNEIGLLEELKHGLRTLAAFYPAFPLRLLYGDEKLAPPGDTELQKFKGRLAQLQDRTERVATFTQANGVYIAFDLGMLKVSPNISLANFPAIEAYPASEESKRIAAAVRSTVTSFVGHHHQRHATTWPVSFWNRGLELEGCEFS